METLWYALKLYFFFFKWMNNKMCTECHVQSHLEMWSSENFFALSLFSKEMTAL